jgi:hypothetical protein
MRKYIMVLLVCFMLMTLGVAQAAPSQNSSHARTSSKTIYIQAAETTEDAYGIVVSEISGGNAKIMVLYPNVIIELPVIERSDGSLAVMAMGFAGHIYWQMAIPIIKNQQGQDTIPLMPYLNIMFETSDDGDLYVPMQDPEKWLPWLPPIITGTIF